MIPAHLRKKRIWNVADFAEFTGLSHKAAKARLKTYNEQMNGMLLVPSRGANREYTFLPSVLARAISGLFDPIESLEVRVDELEDKVGELHQAQRIVAQQCGTNTRDIGKLRRPKHAAA
jgi:hypothetical protein